MEMHVNWLAVVVAALMPMVVGFIWYHPAVMGKMWMKATGLTEADRPTNPGLTYGLALGLSFLLALFLMINVTGFGQEDPKFHTFQHGVGHAVLLTLLFVLPLFGTNALFEKRSLNWVIVNVGYWFFAMALALGILSAWR